MASKQITNRPGFHSPLYSEATIHNGTVYCSGKVGLDMATAQLVGDDVGEQTVAALKLIEAVLHAAGSDLSNMLKCNIFFADMSDYAAMNAAYTATVPDPKPARVCVGNAKLGKGAKVDIDCVASLDELSYDMRNGAKGGLYGFARDDYGVVKIGYRGTKVDAAARVIGDFVQEFLPELLGCETRTRLCWYTDSCDNHFVVDAVPGVEGLMVATGGSGGQRAWFQVLAEPRGAFG
ncbi:Endoribonuclease L-PSP/chorismate mutase-like protein [Aspergillus heterothallicus]